MKGKMINNKNVGFSLVELIIVIAIMAVLAGAIAPALIRYIDKSRKEVDVQNAQMLFEAANLAAATSDDEAAYGWAVIAEQTDRTSGRTDVTYDGHQARSGGDGTYSIRLVAWCRGVRHDGNYGGAWENSLFKAAMDGRGGAAAAQRAYTDEFLMNLNQDRATGGYDNGNRTYDGQDNGYVYLKCKKYSKLISPSSQTNTSLYNGNITPECWCVYRRDDTGAPEIWVGYKISGQPVKPLYRLHPNPCPEYAN